MSHSFWILVTQLGNALWLMPAAAILALWLWFSGSRRLALCWAAGFAGAIALVLGSKIAFLGFGIGNKALDFTGISGHATVATAVFTMLLYVWPRTRSSWVTRLAVVAGLLIGVAVGVSRLVLRAHSVSEVVAGCALGAGVAVAAILLGRHLRQPAPHRWIAVAVLVVLLVAPQMPQRLQSHDIVEQLALTASGRTTVFSRATW